MAPEIIGNHLTLPFVRKVTAADDLQSRLFGLTGIHPEENPGQLVWQAPESSPRKTVIDALPVCPISHESLAPLIPDHSPWVHAPHGINFQPPRLGAVLPPAAAAQLPHAVGRLGTGMDIDALSKIQATIRPPLDAVQDVVSVLGAKSAQ